MRSLLTSYPVLAALFIVLLTSAAVGTLATGPGDAGVVPDLRTSPVDPLDPTGDALEAGGPPSCMGYTLDDPCINRRNLAECRRAVKKCGEGQVLVLFSCPLQFRCGN